MEAENVRRDKFRDGIKNLLESQLEDAKKAEEERRRLWDDRHAEYLARRGSPGTSETQSASESALPLNNKSQRRKIFARGFHHKGLH
jgi:hypothetical protein